MCSKIEELCISQKLCLTEEQHDVPCEVADCRTYERTRGVVLSDADDSHYGIQCRVYPDNNHTEQAHDLLNLNGK